MMCTCVAPPLYYDTFKRMQLQDRQLIPTEKVFHGIVPGKSAKPIGKIYLEVAFGTVENFRSEIMSFEVVDLKSPYHALFGRPAYFKFMARPCYVYLKLKMPGPAGVITVNGSKQMALECELGDAAMAETACAQEEFKFYKANVDPEDNSVLKKPATEEKMKFKSAQDTKTVDFTPGDSSKQFVIGGTSI